MRIRKEANVEEQIGVVWPSMLEAEADAGHEDVLVRLLFMKAFGDVRPQFMDIEPGGIDDQVRHGADGTQVAALGGQRRLHRRVCSERMRPASLAEAPQKDGI